MDPLPGKVVIWDRTGDPAVAMGTHADITIQKQSLEALVRTETRFRDLFQHSTSAIAYHELVFDETGEAVDYILIDANPAWEKMLGRKKEELVGKRTGEFFGTEIPPYL